jgi:chromosomal replication initiation ATPase DnaA
MMLGEEALFEAWSEERSHHKRDPHVVALTERVAKLEAELHALIVQFTKRPVAPELPRPSHITKRMIMDAVCIHYGAAAIDLASKRREGHVVYVRQIAAYLMRTLTTQSMPQIGDELGGRDHTTIMHAVRKITVQRVINPDLDNTLKEIEAGLRARVAGR